jgi:PAS domain S-box-containing protein
MDQIWLTAPSPAMRLGREAGAPGWRVNAAAQAWADARGLGGDCLWSALAAELRAVPAGATGGELAGAPLHWQAVPIGDSRDDDRLVWFSPSEAQPWRSAADKLALMQDFVAIGVFERDLRTYEARWDAQMFRLFGLDPSEGSPPLERAMDLVHPGDRERFMSEHLRFLREGGRHSLRFRVVWPDGSLHDLQSLLEVRLAADGTPLLLTGVIMDDSVGAGLVRAQQAVSAHLARALHLAKVAVWRVDFASQRIHFNDAGYEQIGIAPRAKGVGIDELRSWAHPDDLQNLLRATDLATAGTEVIDLELRFRHASGGYRPLLTRRVAERDERGKVIGLLGITIDQSAQMAVRDRIQALSRRIEVVADAADLGIWSVDGATGRVEWNAQMFRIYGIDPDQLPASLLAWRDAYVHPEDHVALAQARRAAAKVGSKAFETEFRIVRPDGSVRWVTSRSRREEHDGHLMLIGIHLDTTELIMQRQRVEQALHEKEMALRASQAKSDFLSRASHELRTPLNAVLGFAQLIEHEGARATAAQQLERVAHIRSAGEHLLALVDDVLDLAAIEAGSLPVASAPVSLDEVLGDVAQWLASLAQRAAVTLNVKPCGGWVQADPRRLRQIVVNLATNAVKFNHAGGSVWLSASRTDDAAGEHWQISVRDDGRGMSPSEQAHIFEAFRRLGAQRDGIEGVGLGLTIVRQLAELMHGRIEVVSAPGMGSDFRVTLNAASDGQPATAHAAVPAAIADAAAAPSAPAAPSLEVLYIEDNPVNAILVEGLVALRPEARLRCAVDGLSGVAMALQHRPHVVLIDMQLPDIDGFEVRRRLRAETSLDASRLIALSANGLTEDIARALAAGFDDYWTKPIDFKLFLERLDALIATTRPAN